MIAARTKSPTLTQAPAGSISLVHADRHLRRKVLSTDCGESFLLDLAEVAELRDGEALHLEDGRQIQVRAAPEPLAVAQAPGPALARLAWHIGNRHTPCQIDGDRLLIQRDRVLEDMLRRLGAVVSHVDAAFQPETGAYGHGRTHDHAHAEDPHEDPNAHIPRRRD